MFIFCSLRVSTRESFSTDYCYPLQKWKWLSSSSLLKKGKIWFLLSACIKGSLGDSQKLPWDFQKPVPGNLGLPSFKDIWPFIKKNLGRICMLFSLKMAVLLHEYESLRLGRLNVWKWEKQFDYLDFQILELGSPGTSWIRQLVQALFYLTLVLLNPDIPCLCKQCRSRSVGFFREELRSSNLIGWKLEVGVAS